MGEEREKTNWFTIESNKTIDCVFAFGKKEIVRND